MFETHSQNFHDVMTSRHQNIMQLLAQRHKHWQCPVKTTEVPTTTYSILKPWPRGYKTPTTPNSTEHENSPAHKLQNANNCLHFNIYERKPALQVHLSLKIRILLLWSKLSPVPRTGNPLYNGIRYSSKIRYNVNLVCTKKSADCVVFH